MNNKLSLAINIPYNQNKEVYVLFQKMANFIFKDVELDRIFQVKLEFTDDKENLTEDEYGVCEVPKKGVDNVTIWLDEVFLTNDLPYMLAGILAHELEHARQVACEELYFTNEGTFFKGEYIDHLDYKDQPDEILAFEAQERGIDFYVKNMKREIFS